jgi:hypothetical protein
MLQAVVVEQEREYSCTNSVGDYADIPFRGSNGRSLYSGPGSRWGQYARFRLWTPDLKELRRAEFIDQHEVGSGKPGFGRIEFFAKVADYVVMRPLREMVQSHR